MKVVDVVARCLTRAGADVAFGVVGSGNFTVTASLHAHGARVVADPFVPSADAAALLRVRGARRSLALGWTRGRRRRRRRLPARPAIAFSQGVA